MGLSMARQEGKHLLIYPLGNSAIAFTCEHTYPREHARDHRSFGCLSNVQSPDLVRNVAISAWNSLAALAPLPPAAPAWARWGRKAPVPSPGLGDFEAQLEAGFKHTGCMMQQGCKCYGDTLKADLTSEVRGSGLPQRTQQRPVHRLAGYEPPRWGPWLAHGFIHLKENILNRKWWLRCKLLAGLHPHFDFKARRGVKSHLGQYLKGDIRRHISFKELFARLTPRTTRYSKDLPKSKAKQTCRKLKRGKR